MSYRNPESKDFGKHEQSPEIVSVRQEIISTLHKFIQQKQYQAHLSLSEEDISAQLLIREPRRLEVLLRILDLLSKQTVRLEQRGKEYGIVSRVEDGLEIQELPIQLNRFNQTVLLDFVINKTPVAKLNLLNVYAEMDPTQGTIYFSVREDRKVGLDFVPSKVQLNQESAAAVIEVHFRGTLRDHAFDPSTGVVTYFYTNGSTWSVNPDTPGYFTHAQLAQDEEIIFGSEFSGKAILFQGKLRDGDNGEVLKQNEIIPDAAADD